MSKNQKVLGKVRWINLSEDVSRRKNQDLAIFIHFPQVLVERVERQFRYLHNDRKTLPSLLLTIIYLEWKTILTCGFLQMLDSFPGMILKKKFISGHRKWSKNLIFTKNVPKYWKNDKNIPKAPHELVFTPLKPSVSVIWT